MGSERAARSHQGERKKMIPKRQAQGEFLGEKRSGIGEGGCIACEKVKTVEIDDTVATRFGDVLCGQAWKVCTLAQEKS